MEINLGLHPGLEMELGLRLILNLGLCLGLGLGLVLGLKIEMTLGIGGITYDKENKVERVKILEHFCV